MNKNIVRWAILGPGRIAHSFARDFRSVRNAELVAVASREAKRARQFADQYGIEFVLTYNELYASKLVDAVYIATPHSFHYEQSLACLRNAKAVLCEKPITINDSQFQELAEVSARNNVFLMEAMWTYFLPAMQRAKQWITDGRIGSVKVIQADFGHAMEFNPYSRIYDSMLGGGALLDLGIYPVALSTQIMNQKPQHIQASAIIGKTGVDDSTAMIFQYGDATAVLHTTILATTTNTALIFGENGFIEIPDFYKASVCRLYNAQKMLIESFTDDRTTGGYNFETQEATDCILYGLVESPALPHSRSNELQEIMMEVRKQIGLRYPMDK